MDKCALLSLLMLTSAANAQSLAGDDASINLGAAAVAAQQPAGDAPAQSTPVPRFGQARSQWWKIGGGVSKDLHDATDAEVFGAYSFFLADDVEWSLEGGVWNLALDGPDAQGVNLSMIFRWHFFDNEKWTLYADAGIGVLVSTDDVPNDGTSFNFTPRLGVGFTRRLTDSGVRLEGGLRWAHISNARITGDSDNPARDSAMAYVGLIFPF